MPGPIDGSNIQAGSNVGLPGSAESKKLPPKTALNSAKGVEVGLRVFGNHGAISADIKLGARWPRNEDGSVKHFISDGNIFFEVEYYDKDYPEKVVKGVIETNAKEGSHTVQQALFAARCARQMHLEKFLSAVQATDGNAQALKEQINDYAVDHVTVSNLTDENSTPVIKQYKSADESDEGTDLKIKKLSGEELTVKQVFDRATGRAPKTASSQQPQSSNWTKAPGRFGRQQGARRMGTEIGSERLIKIPEIRGGREPADTIQFFS